MIGSFGSPISGELEFDSHLASRLLDAILRHVSQARS